MPSTVADVFAAARAKPAGVVGWGEPVGPPPARTKSSTGIYVVALTDAVDRVDRTLADAPILPMALTTLLRRRPELTLDGRRPTARQLAARLGEFWFPDETILYIGLADARDQKLGGGYLAYRVHEYVKTRIGAKSPHAGGWPLKTLDCLGSVYVHYTYCGNVMAAEGKCLRQFADQVSPSTLDRLRDPVRVMPFANLEFPRGNRKNHGIKHARGPLPLSSLTAAERMHLY